MDRITYKERENIERLIKSMGKVKYRAIWRAMWKPHTTIRYEIIHHSGASWYNADIAQWIYERNQRNKGNILKIEKWWKLEKYIIKMLKAWWSPENISWRIKNIKEELDLAWKYVCHETIYTYIYSEKNRKKKYWKYLRRHKRKRYKHWTRKSRKGWTVKNMISISQRADIVNNRQRVWDWETDSVQFSWQKWILSVQVERKTRVVRITKCKNKTAQETYDAIYSQLWIENAEHLKTLTFDRWTEWAMHEKLAKELWLKIYFCHAYCSWEKWAVENRNMFIREYLPRNTIIADVSDSEIYKIQEILNNRPMKCLWYRTPNEMMFYEIFWRFPNPIQDIIFPNYEIQRSEMK